MLFSSIHYVGLSALPVLFLPGGWSWRAFFRALLLLGLGAWLLALLRVPPYGGLFPYLGNCLTPWGQYG